MTWEDFGGRIEPEARRLAFMLNTGNPNAEHQAAMQLSQDLYGLPGQAQVDLVRSTQMYDGYGLGAQVVVEPMLNQAPNGRVYDTGNRDVRVIDQENGVNDDVAIMNGNNSGYRMPGFRIDLFAGINGCSFGETPWLYEGGRDGMFHERQNWLGRRDEWEGYDGRMNGRPGFVRPVIRVDVGPVHVGVGVPGMPLPVPIIGGGRPIFEPHRVDPRDPHRFDKDNRYDKDHPH